MTSSNSSITKITQEIKPRDTPLSHEELLKLFKLVDPCRSGPRDKIQWSKHPSLEREIYDELHISRTQAQNYLSRNKHLKRPLPIVSQSASVVTRSNSLRRLSNPKLALEMANDDFNVAVDTLLAEPVRYNIQEKCMVAEIDEESFFEYHNNNTLNHYYSQKKREGRRQFSSMKEN
jgi:hypothetical protein